MMCCLFRPTDSTSPAPNISASRWPGSGAVAARHCRPVPSGLRKCIGCCAAIPKRRGADIAPAELYVEKIRHIVPYGNLNWEIDVFSGENQGLVVAEVELPDEN